jgi:uncharacterized protein HemX
VSEIEDMSTVNPSPNQADQPSSEPMLDVKQALGQLRMLCCGLGLGLLMVSLALSTFIWKQNRNITAETNARIKQTTQVQQQADQIQNGQQRFRPIVEELARYSVGNPELMEVFKRSGLNLTGLLPSNPPPSSVSAPTPGAGPGQ